MRAVSYTDITPMAPEWLWRGRIPLDEVTLVAGEAGIGKGMLDADLVSRVTRGAPMPGEPEDSAMAPANVILVTSEDDPNMATSWRLRAAHADLGHVYDFTQDFTVPDSLSALREEIDEVGDVRLVIIDPLSDVSSIPLTSSSVRIRSKLMRPMERLAKDEGIALEVVHHTVKSGRVAGSKAITDAARMVLRITRSPVDDRIRLIHVEKSNIASDTTGDIAYTITGDFPDTHVVYMDVPDLGVAAGAALSVPGVVRAVLDSSDQPLETHEVARRAQAPYGSVRVALTRMGKDDGSPVFSPQRGMWWSHVAMEREVRS